MWTDKELRVKMAEGLKTRCIRDLGTRKEHKGATEKNMGGGLQMD